MTFRPKLAKLSAARSTLTNRLQSRHHVLVCGGLLMAIVGIAALLWPILFAYFATFMIGWLITVAGAVLFFESFCYKGSQAFFGALFLAMLTFSVGAFLLFAPGSGVVFLTLLIAVVLTTHGAFELVLAVQLRHLRSWWCWLFAGLVGVAAGLLVTLGFPDGSALALSLFIGIKFLASGVAFLALAQTLKEPLQFNGIAKAGRS